MNDHVDEYVFEWRQSSRQFPFKLFGCDPRLKTGLRVDDIANGLRLREVDAFVCKSAKGEFAWFCDPRPSLDCQLKHACKNDWASVATYFYNVFARVRVW